MFIFTDSTDIFMMYNTLTKYMNRQNRTIKICIVHTKSKCLIFEKECPEYF